MKKLASFLVGCVFVGLSSGSSVLASDASSLAVSKSRVLLE